MSALRPKILTRYSFVAPGAAPGGQIIHDIKLGNASKGWLLKRVKLILRGQVVISGQTVAGTLNGENPWGLVSKIYVETTRSRDGVPDGKILDLTPRTLIRRRVFDRGMTQPDVRTAAGITAANGTYLLNSPIEIPFALPRCVTPIETALRLDDYNSIRITLNTQALAAIFVGNASTVDYTGLYVDVVEDREYNPNYEPYAVIFQDDKFVPIAGANARMVLSPFLPINGLYGDVLVITETTNATLADTILNRLYVKSASDTQSDLYFDDIKSDQQDFVTDQAQSMVGLHYIPLLAGLEDNRALLRKPTADVSLEADVSNPGTDRMILSSRRIAVRVPTPGAKPGNNAQATA